MALLLCSAMQLRRRFRTSSPWWMFLSPLAALQTALQGSQPRATASWSAHAAGPLYSVSDSKGKSGLDGRSQLTSPAAQTMFSLCQSEQPQTACTAGSRLPLPPFLPVTEPVMSSAAQQHAADASKLALLLNHARLVQVSLQLLAEGAKPTPILGNIRLAASIPVHLGLRAAAPKIIVDSVLKRQSRFLFGMPGCVVADRGVSRADLSSLALQIAAALPRGVARTPVAGSRVAPIAEHGNYRRYYNYRVPDAFSEDPRLQVRLMCKLRYR